MKKFEKLRTLYYTPKTNNIRIINFIRNICIHTFIISVREDILNMIFKKPPRYRLAKYTDGNGVEEFVIEERQFGIFWFVYNKVRFRSPLTHLYKNVNFNDEKQAIKEFEEFLEYIKTEENRNKITVETVKTGF